MKLGDSVRSSARPLRLRARFQHPTLLALPLLAALSMGGCGPGFLGLHDWGRDILFSLGGSLAGALISGALPDNGAGGDGSNLENPGPPGEPGPQGPPGPPIFAVFVDSIFTAQADEVFGVRPVRMDEPKLGEGGSGALAYSVAIPSNFEGVRPITMRVVLFRTGPCSGGCFAFSVDARRAQPGDAAPQCFGGAASDCSDGTRYVLVHDVCPEATDSADVREFLLIDLPLDGAGLDFPAVAAGDLLAFELNTHSSDGGTYHLMGVEFSDAEETPAAGMPVFKSADELSAACGS